MPSSRPQACGGTASGTECRAQSRPPSTAVNAIGMPKLNATPSTACGIESARLANGYSSVIARPATESQIVGGLVVNTSAKATAASAAPSVSASRTLTRPLVTGRSAVRFTCRS